MFKQLFLGVLVAFIVADFAQACAPPPPAGNGTSTGRRRRDAEGLSVAVSTFFDFDENENSANIASLGQQLKQLAKSQELDLAQFGKVSKSAENDGGKLLVRYSAESGDCEQVKAFVSEAVQLAAVVKSASVDCDGSNTVIDKQQPQPQK